MSEPLQTVSIDVSVNGKACRRDVEPRQLLVEFIREELRLTGTHIGCDTSFCGACTVLLDGAAVKSCTLFAVQADGAEITTVEALERDRQLHPLQQAFSEQHGLQCGYCTPGILMSSLEFGVGDMGPQVGVRGTDRALNYWMLANFINSNSASLPDELRDLSLNARHVYMPPFKVPDVEKKIGNLTLTYALQLHISVVEVDPDTFRTRILDYSIVDDCGTVINPMIVEGQVHGAAAHGIGAALVEDISYDADGNAIAGSFTDYAPITISTMPELKCSNRQSPSPFTFHGAKGMGEGGGGPLHSLCAALQDALHGRDIIIENSHNSPMSMFERFSSEPHKGVSVESR